MKKILLSFGLLLVCLSSFFLFSGMSDVPGQIVETTSVEESVLYKISLSYPQIREDKDFNAAVLKIIQKLVTDFKSVQTAVDRDFGPGSLDISYEVSYRTPSFVSLAFSVEEYVSGTAHGGHFSISMNYDFQEKKNLALGDIFDPGTKYVEEISKIAIDMLQKQERERLADGWVENGAGPDAKNFSVFNLTKTSLFLIFNEYQIAPYAAGAFGLEIPLVQLRHFIRPEFQKFSPGMITSYVNREVLKIKRDTKKYKKVSKDLMDESTEGGTLEGYFEKDILKRMKATYFGESGKTLVEYFFVNADLIVIVNRTSSYNASISDASHDAALTKTISQKYYLDAKKIIRAIPSLPKQSSPSASSLLEECEDLKKRLQ